MPALRPPRVSFVLVVIVSCAAYWLTAYPSITWWDSSVYSLGAVTLGITHPPGSLLLTMLGWLVTRLPLGLPPAYVLNLFAGLLAALATGLAYLAARRLLYGQPRDAGPAAPGASAVAGAVLGALALAFGLTLWQHAVKFTPYVLTAVFTGMMLLVMLRWWDDAARHDGVRSLLTLGLLLGLDFSVHRTNLLLLPGLFVWIVLRRPRTLFSGAAWLAGMSGVVAGLAFHLLIIPLAATDPILNFGDPSTWSRFWEYVSLSQYGGGFLVRVFPRNAPLWSVQVMDLGRALGANFFHLTGPLGVLGLLPGLFGVLGLVLLWRRHRALGTALVVLMAVHAAATVLYFNIPANFFRPFTRHYLPVLVPFGVAAAYGLGRTLEYVVASSRGGVRHAAAVATLALVPGAQLAGNWAAVDGSAHYFAEDHARNLLTGLPEDAILFTSGDNDTWPLWYMQTAHGVRPDVQVINLPLTNTDWFLDQQLRRDPAFAPSIGGERNQPAARPWTDTTIAIPVRGRAAQLGLPAGSVIPEAIGVRASPTMGGAVLRQDLVVLRIFRETAWRRPVCFSLGVAPSASPWLAPFRRVDGLHARIVPQEEPPPDVAILRANLLERYAYRGYADDRVRVDDVTRRMGQQYYLGFSALASAEDRGGEPERCNATREAMVRLLPPGRLEPGIPLASCERGPAAEEDGRP